MLKVLLFHGEFLQEREASVGGGTSNRAEQHREGGATGRMAQSHAWK